MASRISPGRLRVAYYRRHFLESLRPDGVVCLECGKLRKTLGTHVLLLHHMTLDDYREEWGFNRQTVFIAASTAARLRRLALKRHLGAAGSAELLAKARAARRRGELPKRLEARLTLSEATTQRYASGWQPRRYRKVDDQTLRRLARGRVDTKRIARQTGLSVDQTRRRLQALGLLPPRRRRRVADRPRILALRRAGLWPLEIARRLRIQPQLVRKILWQLRRQGVAISTPSRPRPIKKRRVTDEAFLRAFRRGGTPAQMAARLGVSRAYVIGKTWYLRRRGLIAPAPRRRIRQQSRRPGRPAGRARRSR
jgi:AraC-like DNA-binding protein